MRVLKYPIPRNPNEYGVYPLTIPTNAKVLSAALVGGEVVIYAMVPSQEVPDREIAVAMAGTGKPMPEEMTSGWQFLGTVKQEQFVWHVFIKDR